RAGRRQLGALEGTEGRLGARAVKTGELGRPAHVSLAGYPPRPKLCPQPPGVRPYRLRLSLEEGGHRRRHVAARPALALLPLKVRVEVRQVSAPLGIELVEERGREAAEVQREVLLVGHRGSAEGQGDYVLNGPGFAARRTARAKA